MLYALAIKKLFEITLGAGSWFWMRIKDVQEWDLPRSKFQNWMIVYRGEEVGGGPKFRFFCGHHKWMIPYKFFFTIEYDFFLFLFFFVSSLSALS